MSPRHDPPTPNGLGPPVRTEPFPPWPSHSATEIEAAAAVLRSGKVNYWNGAEGRAFEEEFARATGCRYAVAVSNGTVALELALRAVGIGPGDEVIVPPRTFLASASAVVMVGASPVFADVDPDSGNLSVESVRAAVTPRTRGVVAVHLAGWPCDMDGLRQVAADHGLKILEDCAQAHGAQYRHQPVGSLGDVAAFSFCTDKILSTGGEGGMITTNSEAVWDKCWSFKDHGKSWDAVYRRKHESVFRWLHESFGTNARMTEMQAALGRAVLERLPEFVERRRRNAAVLAAELADHPLLRVPVPPADVRHSYYKFYAYLKPSLLREGWTRDRIVQAVQAEGIPCGSGSCSEIYLERAFDGTPWRPRRRLPVARQLGETSLMFLVHPTLGDGEMRDTARAVHKVLAAAKKPNARRKAA